MNVQLFSGTIKDEKTTMLEYLLKLDCSASCLEIVGKKCCPTLSNCSKYGHTAWLGAKRGFEVLIDGSDSVTLLGQGEAATTLLQSLHVILGNT